MSKEQEAKMKALQLTLDKLDKTYGKGAVMKMGDTIVQDVEVISSGSIGLNAALGVQGYPKGRVIEIYGPESSGKTTLTLHAIAEAQRAGGIAAFIDAEHAFDRFTRPSWGSILTTSSFRSLITVNRPLKSQTTSFALEPLISWSLTRWPLLLLKVKLKVKWATPRWGFTPDSCLRHLEN